GGGTVVASRTRRDNGSMARAKVPSLKGRLSCRRTRSSATRRMFSRAIGGRRMYLQSASRPTASSALAVVAACSEKPCAAAQSPLGCSRSRPGRRRMGSFCRSVGPAGTRPRVEATASSASAGSVSARVSSALTACTTRIRLPEAERSERKQRRNEQLLLEERQLHALLPDLTAWVTQLHRRAPRGRAIARLRHLRRLLSDYPQTPLHLALDEAARYGLYDLKRIEAMVLRRIDGDFFPFDFDTEEE